MLHQHSKLLCFRGYHQEREKITHKTDNIFANCLSDEGLISMICKEGSQVNRKASKLKFLKQSCDLKRQFSKEDIQMPNKQMKICSTSLAKGKQHTRHHLHLVGASNMVWKTFWFTVKGITSDRGSSFIKWKHWEFSGHCS